MNKIKLYIAGDFANGTEKYVDSLPRNRLVSYSYPNQFDQWLKLTGSQNGNIMIDSGAFSAWNNNRELNLDKYIEYINQAKEKSKHHNKKIYAVNLDVIPGKVGETGSLMKFLGSRKKIRENREIIDKAAQEGFDNMLIMKQNGIDPIHVFHQGEDWKWLDKMVEEVNYIGISPANDMPVNSRKNWIEKVFTYIYKNNIKVKTHGFAVWVFDILKNFPFTSCDAASWTLQAGYGTIMYPNKGFKNTHDVSKRSSYDVITISSKRNAKRNIKPGILKQIENDGYDYEDLQHHLVRRAINLRFINLLEKSLNQYRTNKEFIPNTGLLK